MTNPSFRFAVAIQTFINWLLTPYYRYCVRKKTKVIPEIANDILKYSATILAQKIRQKKVSCKEVIIAYTNRIKEVNPIINAVVEERFSDALKKAEEIDKVLANNELSEDCIEKKYPLLGVPLTVKESCGLEGLSYTVGSKYRINIKAEKDGEAIYRLKQAGAIPLLVSNTPELCLAWETTNFLTGRTLNPYNTNHTSGGSSGGEGALLGSGASVIGVGSDIAGSIRIPALFNGVFGHKPTPHVISIDGHFPIVPDEKFPDFLVVGPMTRYAEDLKLMTSIMCNNPAQLQLDRNIQLNKLNIFFMEKAESSIVLPRVNSEIKLAMRKCLEHLKQNCGSSICDYKFDMKYTAEMSGTIFYKMNDIPSILRDPRNEEVRHNLCFEILKATLGLSEHSLIVLFSCFLEKTNVFVSKRKYPEFCDKAERLRKDFINKLGNNGVFLYPTFPVPAFEHNKSILLISGTMYTMVFNILGLPATHVPLGKDRNDLPIGIQVVAAPYQDVLCFAIAEELEKCFGGWSEP